MVLVQTNEEDTDCKFAMEFVEEPPKYVFKNEWFDVRISASFSGGFEKNSNGDDASNCILLKPTLCWYRNLTETDGHASHIPLASSIPPIGLQLDMNPTIITLSWDEKDPTTTNTMTKEGRAKCKISCHDTFIDVTSFSGFYRLEFQVVKGSHAWFLGKTLFSRPFKFADAKLSLDSPEWDDVWYKDMGGKEKSIRVTVCLVDAHGNLIKDRRVPLKFTLLYDNESKSPVSNQKIFRLLDDTSQHIYPNMGETLIKFRIDDVSKNHQGQNFILEVAADDCPGIAPTYSKSVCIRSKKRRNFNTNNQKRQKMNCGTPQMTDQCLERNDRNTCDNHLGIGLHYDNQKLQDAMQSIVQWTDEVVNGLEPLKWTIIGYAQSQEGDIDYSRPFHNMTNPNDKLDHILQRYSDDVQDHLRVLASAIETLFPYSGRTSCHKESTMNADYNSNTCYSKHFYATPQDNFSPDQTHHKSTGAQHAWHESYRQNGFLSQKGSIVSPQGLQGRSRDDCSPRSLPYDSCGHTSSSIALTPGDLCRNDAVGTDILSYSNHDDQDESYLTSPPEYLSTDVFYIFAKVFKSLKTDQVLGFPAYNEYKELLGFFDASALADGRTEDFVPIQKYQHEFGPEELIQARQVLQDALSRQSKAVLALDDWGSISSMVEHVSHSYNHK